MYGSRIPNSFSGEVPEDFSRLGDKLTMLSLAYNQFTSSNGLPSAIKAYSKAKAIYLQYNKFSGDIDDEGFLWPNLRALNIHNNTLSGEFPSALFMQSKNWHSIDIGNNPNLGKPASAAGNESFNAPLPGGLCSLLPSEYEMPNDDVSPESKVENSALHILTQKTRVSRV